MKLVRITIVLAATAILAGCASTLGTQVTREQTAFIKRGKTTRAEIIAAFGEPDSVLHDSSGRETITYTYSRAQVRPATFIPVVGAFAGGMDVKSTSFQATLTPAGVVDSFGDSQMRIGAGDAAR